MAIPFRDMIMKHSISVSAIRICADDRSCTSAPYGACGPDNWTPPRQGLLSVACRAHTLTFHKTTRNHVAGQDKPAAASSQLYFEIDHILQTSQACALHSHIQGRGDQLAAATRKATCTACEIQAQLPARAGPNSLVCLPTQPV